MLHYNNIYIMTTMYNDEFSIYPESMENCP